MRWIKSLWCMVVGHKWVSEEFYRGRWEDGDDDSVEWCERCRRG